MKGASDHPYPPKCQDPYQPLNSTWNRPLARIVAIFDEDDLNRSAAANGSAVERLTHHATPTERKAIQQGLSRVEEAPMHDASQSGAGLKASQLDELVAAALARAASSECPIDAEEDSQSESDSEVDLSPDADDDERERIKFRHAATGLRSAIRGVISFTATPGACGHDLPNNASKIDFHVLKMMHPQNYVGYDFQSAPYATHTIRWEQIPDRRQLKAIAKSIIYRQVLTELRLWVADRDCPPPPFRVDKNGTISVRKKDLEGDDDALRRASPLCSSA